MSNQLIVSLVCTDMKFKIIKLLSTNEIIIDCKNYDDIKFIE